MLLDHFLLFGLCILYGIFFVLGKIALQFSAPIFFTAVRMILAGVLLICYYYFAYKPNYKLTVKQWVYMFAIALFGIYITNASEFWGLQFISAGKTSLLCCFYPIITAIISCTFFKEKMTIKKAVGLLIGTLGFVPVIASGEKSLEELSGTLSIFSYAEIALIIAAIATALGWLITRDAIRFTKLDIVILNGVSMLLGGIMSLIHSYYTESWQPLPIYDMKKFFLILTVIMVTSNIISYNLHGYLLKRFTASYISFANLIDPVIASFFGWLLLGEVLNGSFWLSALCIGIGLSLYYKENLRLKE